MTDVAFDLYLLAAALGLIPAVAYAGMPVLAQSAFVAAGAVGAMQLERLGLPIGSAVLVAVVAGAALGALTGVLVSGAERPRVALATWGLAWLATTALLAFPGLSGGTQGLTRPALDHVQTIFGATLTLTPGLHVAVAAALCLLALWVAARLRAGPAGLDAIAVREDPEVAHSLGVPVVLRQVALLALAGGFGAAAGAGYSLLIGVAAPADTSPLLALQLFAAVIVGAGAPIAGPLLAYAVLAGIPRAADALTATGISAEASNGVMTAAALVACLWLRPHVVARTALRRSSGSPPPPATPAEPMTGGALLLNARDLEDPLGILHGFGLELRAGEVHALIGPNGSGKTTALRVLSGALPATRGTVDVDGGIVRTFQRAASLHPLSPLDQVRLAQREPALAHFTGFADAPDDPWPALALTELTTRAHVPAGQLGAGDERLLQIARAVATGARVLALDEPAAGMRPDERETLLRVLRRLAERGCAVLVVEHDLRLVAGAADVVTVLDDGRVVASGPPEEVIADPTVRRVYLGVGA